MTHRLSQVIALVTFVLLVSGGLVVSTESSLAVPDWPLSLGQWMPRMVGGVLFEHGHRMMGATVGSLVLLLALSTVFREPRPWVRRLALLALAAVVTQGILGGPTVYLKLPRIISVTHASLAQFIFCLMISMAVLTTDGWEDRVARLGRGGLTLEDARSRAALVLVAAVLTQMVLGALLRLTRPGVSIPLVIIHAGFAFVVIAAVGWLVARAITQPGKAQGNELLTWTLAVLVGVQFILGFIALAARLTSIPGQPSLAKMVIPTVHHSTGALILGLSVFLFWRSELGAAEDRNDPMHAALPATGRA